MADWLLHPRRRRVVDALVLAWVLVWALAGYAAAHGLDRLGDVARSAEGTGAAVERTGRSIRDVDLARRGRRGDRRGAGRAGPGARQRRQRAEGEHPARARRL